MGISPSGVQSQLAGWCIAGGPSARKMSSSQLAILHRASVGPIRGRPDRDHKARASFGEMIVATREKSNLAQSIEAFRAPLRRRQHQKLHPTYPPIKILEVYLLYLYFHVAEHLFIYYVLLHNDAYSNTHTLSNFSSMDTFTVTSTIKKQFYLSQYLEFLFCDLSINSASKGIGECHSCGQNILK
jgi:hypothetical protein